MVSHHLVIAVFLLAGTASCLPPENKWLLPVFNLGNVELWSQVGCGPFIPRRLTALLTATFASRGALNVVSGLKGSKFETAAGSLSTSCKNPLAVLCVFVDNNNVCYCLYLSLFSEYLYYISMFLDNKPIQCHRQRLIFQVDILFLLLRSKSGCVGLFYIHAISKSPINVHSFG